MDMRDPVGQNYEPLPLSVATSDGARAGFQQALTLARQAGDLSAERAALHALAVLAAQQGNVAAARAGFQQALTLARQLGDASAERAELHALAVLDAQEGNVAAARAGYQQAQALARQVGDPSAELRELYALAVLDANIGLRDEARAGFQQALALARQLGAPSIEAMVLLNLGVFIAKTLDETDSGRAMIEQALAISERLGDAYAIGEAYQFLAWLDEDAEDTAGAVAHFREALRRFVAVGSPGADEVRRDLARLGFADGDE